MAPTWLLTGTDTQQASCQQDRFLLSRRTFMANNQDVFIRLNDLQMQTQNGKEMLEIMARNRPIDANDVADWFINRVDRPAGATITPAIVQKLVFLAQAWHLANTCRPMFRDEFEA